MQIVQLFSIMSDRCYVCAPVSPNHLLGINAEMLHSPPTNLYLICFFQEHENQPSSIPWVFSHACQYNMKKKGKFNIESNIYMQDTAERTVDSDILLSSFETDSHVEK